MDIPHKKTSAPVKADTSPPAERRRIGKIVHDERGNASLSWQDAPADLERPVLEVLGARKLALKSEQTFDPYAHRPTRGTGNTTRTDLRKLSEWIKMMKALEERKRNGGGDGDGE